MNYKILVTDIDGTLLNDEHKIPKGNLDALKKLHAKGGKIALCTGRSLKSVAEFEKKLGLNVKGNYGIGYHGARIHDSFTGEIVKEFKVSVKILKKVLDLAKGYNFTFLIHDSDKLYSNKMDQNVRYYENRCGDVCEIIDFEQIDSDISKVILKGDSQQLMDFASKLPEDLKEQCNHFFASSTLYEFISKEASKGNALKYLCDTLKIDVKKSVGAGDNYNDMSLITESGLGVAVKNAVKGIIEVADYVTQKDNNNCAIKEIIDKFF